MSNNEANNRLIYTGKQITIEIDGKSGFCFGVRHAIDKAEEQLQKGEKLVTLGDIVHNQKEIERLEAQGMKTLSYPDFETLENKKVLFRAHGEPPESYERAKANNLQVIDGTCPVVLKLQERVRNAWEAMKKVNGQIIIFGKKGHAEVIGLAGQTENQALIISSIDDLSAIDFNRPIELFSQTTSSIHAYQYLIDQIQKKAKAGFRNNDTICRQVSNREPRLRSFVKNFDVFIFVGGKKSSNAKFLYQICKETNPNAYLISNVDEIDFSWFSNKKKVGISGATSTPLWLMQQVADFIHQKLNKE
ncbi:MAG: 4-hydroxy-3-methylbut-2-enyl diphosphate reductase [Salinivirgaceae bacterium]